MARLDSCVTGVNSVRRNCHQSLSVGRTTSIVTLIIFYLPAYFRTANMLLHNSYVIVLIHSINLGNAHINDI